MAGWLCRSCSVPQSSADLARTEVRANAGCRPVQSQLGLGNPSARLPCNRMLRRTCAGFGIRSERLKDPFQLCLEFGVVLGQPFKSGVRGKQRRRSSFQG
jgi:hypothetical protein